MQQGDLPSESLPRHSEGESVVRFSSPPHSARAERITTPSSPLSINPLSPTHSASAKPDSILDPSRRGTTKTPTQEPIPDLDVTADRPQPLPPSISPSTKPLSSIQLVLDMQRKGLLNPKNIVKDLLQRGGPGGTELSLASLDPTLLSDRLGRLEQDLATTRAHWERVKGENEWYRKEIECIERDTKDYITYLEGKREEKHGMIVKLETLARKVHEDYATRRKNKIAENDAKIAELRLVEDTLTIKYTDKEHEIALLADMMEKRQKHEAELARLQQQLKQLEKDNRAELMALDKGLWEKRCKFQLETDTKIRAMEDAAHEKAEKFVLDHTKTLQAENITLEGRLKKQILENQALLDRKASLEQEHRQLLRENQIRNSLIQGRTALIKKAQKHEEVRRQEQHATAVKIKKAIISGDKNTIAELAGEGKIKDKSKSFGRRTGMTFRPDKTLVAKQMNFSSLDGKISPVDPKLTHAEKESKYKSEDSSFASEDEDEDYLEWASDDDEFVAISS